MVLGDSALAYAGNLAYVRSGPYLAAADVDAPFNRRLLEMHDVVFEPSNTPPLEFRAGAANKTFDQALLDSGYLGSIPAGSRTRIGRSSRLRQASTSRTRISWQTKRRSAAPRLVSKRSSQDA